MNILKADLFHLIKDKLYWVLLTIVFCLPIVTYAMFSNMNVQNAVFTGIGASVMCVVSGLFLCIFFGKEYQNNTIRNKICYGESKYKVMAMYFIEGILITLSLVVVSLVSSLLFGSFMGKFEFTSDFIYKLLCQVLILIAYSCLITAVVVSSKSMKVGLLVVILLSVIVSAVAQLLPTLSATNGFANFASRILYMVVSQNLVNSKDGVLQVTKDFQFNHLYLNAILVSTIYIIISISLTTLVVRKQNYK